MANEGRDRRRDALVEQLRRASGKPLSVRELMQRARLHPGERTEAKRALRDLVREGAATKDGKRYAIPGAREQAPAATLAPSRGARPLPTQGRGRGLLGTIKKHRDGFGFVARLDRKGDDVFVPPQEAEKAVDGDLVRVEIVPARGGRTAGRIVEVVERRRRRSTTSVMRPAVRPPRAGTTSTRTRSPSTALAASCGGTNTSSPLRSSRATKPKPSRCFLIVPRRPLCRGDAVRLRPPGTAARALAGARVPAAACSRAAGTA